MFQLNLQLIKKITFRSIEVYSADNSKPRLDRKGLRVGLVTSDSKAFYELLSPKEWLPSRDWTRISIRISTKDAIAVPELKN